MKNGDLLKIYWKKDNSVSIYHENLHALATEMFKVHIETSPEIMQKIFPIKEQGQYNLRNQTHFVIPCVKSVNYDTESIRGLGPKIWRCLPRDIKNEEKVKSLFIVLKLPLRNGNLIPNLTVFLKHI